ncbi:hypothetical protein F5Y07DRAFT_354143 [Xylaria sp. FL0933]|nr:hypothetical protein F5Y07DRAFT_354143 [Xylaria sp. FL0933]
MATKKSAVRGALTPSIATAEMGPEDEIAATPYAQALSRLSPLQSMLAGLAHRNHNQHRRSAWWRHLGMLRRNCARLAEDLVSAVEAARKSAARATKLAKAKGKKRRRVELVSGNKDNGTGGKDDDVAAQGDGTPVKTDENVTRHATWMRDVLVPNCYLAFSQLTADPQFAPLGLVLLGALAQIQAACDIAAPRPAPILLSPFVGDIPAGAESQSLNNKNAPTATATPPVAEHTAASLVPEPGPKTNESAIPPGGKKDGDTERSGGKAISRADVERAMAQQRNDKEAVKAAKTERDSPTVMPTDLAMTAARPPSKRQVSGGADEAVSRPIKKTKTVVATRDGDKSRGADKEKKKKKVKKGDEFDDLFKGLFEKGM